MMTPDDIDVWVGLDVGKSAHHAHALDHDGNTLYDKPLKQDEKAIRTMLGKLSKHGRVLLVVDQPNTIGSLPLTVARNMGIAVAYLPGTAMRRTAQLLPGDAKTDRRDAHVIAWAALKLPETLRDAGPDDETLAALKLLAGHDEDLAHESTRHVNRLRSLLLQTHPAFERALKGERITRDATLALLERYGGPMGVKRAESGDVHRGRPVFARLQTELVYRLRRTTDGNGRLRFSNVHAKSVDFNIFSVFTKVFE